MGFLFIWLLGDVANLLGESSTSMLPLFIPHNNNQTLSRRSLDLPRTNSHRTSLLLLLRRPGPDKPMYLLQHSQRSATLPIPIRPTPSSSRVHRQQHASRVP